MSPRDFLRDPLVHFVVFGVVVFVAQAALTPADEAVQADAILVDDDLVADLTRILAERLERLPTTAELEREVEAWIEREVLVREARALGLDRGDPRIRARLAERMAFVLDAEQVAGEPEEAALRALYAELADELSLTLQVTLRQCFVADSDAGRAAALLAQAEAGATPRQLAERCDAPPGGPVLRGRSAERLTALFGPGFVEGLEREEVGRWHLRRSTEGLHVVRIERRRDARRLSFEEARERVAARWLRAREREASRRAVEALRARYEVRGWPR